MMKLGPLAAGGMAAATFGLADGLRTLRGFFERIDARLSSKSQIPEGNPAASSLALRAGGAAGVVFVSGCGAALAVHDAMRELAASDLLVCIHLAVDESLDETVESLLTPTKLSKLADHAAQASQVR